MSRHDQGPDQTDRTGISNRATAEEEARDRREHPPRRRADQVGGNVDTDPEHAFPEGGGQTAHKTGSHSLEEKRGSARHLDHSAPESHGTDGATGREPATEDDPGRG